jgi:hypothetical protein
MSDILLEQDSGIEEGLEVRYLQGPGMSSLDFG